MSSFCYQPGDPGFNKFRAARIWSNLELRKFAHMFTGTVTNISAANDEDKEGSCYKDYFSGADKYLTTNLQSSGKTDYVLNLEQPLSSSMHNICKCAFNHTTLEHVYECRRAFASICRISSDVVIVVVPYIQQLHGTQSQYLDFWRFSPYAMRNMYEENDLKLRYCSANGAERTSIYLFCIGYRNSKWDSLIPERMDVALDATMSLYGDDYTNIIGGNVIV